MLESIKNQGFDIYEIERGGSVTYHGPGQIVGYPIFKLKDYCPGPKNYVGKLQDVIICVLAEWNIQGVLRKKFPGVWVERAGGTLEKITAIGVRITRGVTMHGWSLNVNVDLKPFALITPCGIEGCHVTSMAQILGEPVDVQEVRKRLAHHFADVFRLGVEGEDGSHSQAGLLSLLDSLIGSESSMKEIRFCGPLETSTLPFTKYEL